MPTFPKQYHKVMRAVGQLAERAGREQRIEYVTLVQVRDRLTRLDALQEAAAKRVPHMP